MDQPRGRGLHRLRAAREGGHAPRHPQRVRLLPHAPRQSGRVREILQCMQSNPLNGFALLPIKI